MKRLIRKWLRPHGASYSLPMVLVAPLYLGLVLFIFEIGGLLLAKIGTQYAAHAAARSAVVWSPQDGDAETKPALAAAAALAPFLPYQPNTSAGDEMAAQYTQAATRGGQNGSLAEFERQFTTARQQSQVVLERQGRLPHRIVRATVTTRVPLRMPMLSKLLARPDDLCVVWESTVELPEEAPESTDGTLGIDYATPMHPTGVLP